VAIVSYASLSTFNNNNSSSFNPCHPHVLPSHHTHLTILVLSLGDKDDSYSYLGSSAKAGNQHKNPGGETKGLHSLIKGSVGHRNIHIRGHDYTYRLINSESMYTWNHKITIIGGAPPRLIPTSSLPVWCHPTTQPWATPESAGTLRLWDIVSGPKGHYAVLGGCGPYARTSLHYPLPT
jgi:hypothetical protein